MKKWLSAVVCFLLFAALLVGATFLLQRKESYRKTHEFYTEKENIDVLFFGASHGMNGIYPMQLFEDYGIVSYNLCGPAHPMPTNYWVMRNALDYKKPQTVVIDCVFSSSSQLVPEKVSHMHRSFDTMPFSKTKVLALKDLIPDDAKKRSAFYWNFVMYHNRWEELGAQDFSFATSKEKGAISLDDHVDLIDQAGSLREAEDGETVQGSDAGEESVGQQYLRRMIEECKARNINVVLTYLPFDMYEPFFEDEIKVMEDLAEEYDVRCINFMEIGVVDYRTDFSDFEHLNVQGARKVTDYLGQYLMAHQLATDQSQNGVYAAWKEDTIEYRREMLAHASTTDGFAYLSQLYKGHVKTYLEIENGCDNKLMKDETFLALLTNLGVDSSKIGKGTQVLLLTDESVQYLDAAMYSSEAGIIIDGTCYECEKGEKGIRLVTLSDELPDYVEKKAF